MSKNKSSLLRIYAFSTIVSVGLVAFVGFQAGIKALFLVLVLAALEITFSVDNAVVNTRILERMTAAWQTAFLTVGIVIAVFGVRVVLPLAIVAAAAGLSMPAVLDLAINNSAEYGHQLETAHPTIAAFGGIFLMMIFLDFFFKERKIKWLKFIESALVKTGKLQNMSIILASASLLLVSSFLGSEERLSVLTAGFLGLLTYLIINSLDTVLNKVGIEKNISKGVNTTFKAGLIGFIYLNVVDASFSLDGVIGAFAITDQILLIATGLGIGALYVRVMTVHMLRHGVLEQYRYLEHGAHYAIGILAILLLASLKFHISEVVTGLTGMLFVVTALVQSYIEAKADRKRNLSKN